MQITAKPEEVYLLENETQNAAKKVIAGKVRELKAAAQPELDIRGMAVDEALPVLDNFLDAAYMGNLPNARIIHGKGTGVLRAAVQDELRRCKYVSPSASASTVRANPASRSSNSSKFHRFLSGNWSAMK